MISSFFKYFCHEDFRPSLQDALTHCGDATYAIGDSVAYRAAGKFKTEEFLIKEEGHTFGLELVSLCMLIKSVPFVTHWINMCAHEKTGSWFLVSLPLGDQCM